MRSTTLTRYMIRQGKTYMNVLLDRPGLKPGTEVTLMYEAGRWEIMERYETLPSRSIKRGWKNDI